MIELFFIGQGRKVTQTSYGHPESRGAKDSNKRRSWPVRGRGDGRTLPVTASAALSEPAFFVAVLEILEEM